MEIGRLDLPSGFELVYREAGSREAPPLLILHVLGSSHIQFEGDVEHFAAQHRVIQPDLRGHGDSGSPPGATVADFTCRKLAEDVSHLLDHLDVKRVDVIGNSLGGNVALELVDLRPGLVRSLVTFGTTYQLKVPRLVLKVRDAVVLLLGRRFAAFAARQVSKTPQGREVLTRAFALTEPHTAKLVGPNICEFDYRPVLERFEGRVLLLQCEGDRGINRALRPTLEALGRYASAEVLHFPGGGHCANVDDPSGFRSVVDAFLAKVAGADAADLRTGRSTAP